MARESDASGNAAAAASVFPFPFFFFWINIFNVLMGAINWFFFKMHLGKCLKANELVAQLTLMPPLLPGGLES